MATDASSNNCCVGMFEYCYKLRTITCLATTWIGGGNYASFTSWVLDIPGDSSRIFTKHPNADWGNCGPNRIPCNWTVVDYTP
jgi:hypothetical protein